MASQKQPVLPVAFYFKVSVGGVLDKDTSFQEVSGIGAQMDTEEFSEGGENRFVYQLPKAKKHQNLVLKRGITLKSSPLVKWCKTVLEGDLNNPIQPKDLVVSLLNFKEIPLRTWNFSNAYPVKWDMEAFNSTKNEVAIEQIELSYTFSKMEK